MKELIKAIAKFNEVCPPIIKDADNPFFKSKYASLDHIQSHIKEPLKQAGLVVIQRNIYDGQLFVETKVIHAESGEFEVSIFPVIVQKNDAQSYGSAVSYAKRYSLSGLLNLIIQDSDDDGNSAGGNNTIGDNKPQKQKPITWLTEQQYNATLAADIKGIEAVLKKYSGDGFGIKKEWKNALEIKLKMLKDGK